MNIESKTQLSERYKDMVLVVVLAFVGIGGFLFINFEDNEAYASLGGLSWRSIPFIYSGLLLGLVGLMGLATVFDIMQLRKGLSAPSIFGAPEPTSSTLLSNWRRAISFVAIVVYAWGIGAFGFAISTVFLLFVMFVAFGRRNLLKNLITALIGSLVLWVLFVGILKLPMRGNIFDPVTPVLTSIYKSTGLR